MSSKPIEATFLSVNLRAILAKQIANNAHGTLVEANAEQRPSYEKDPSQVSDWKKELADRLAANSKLATAEREQDYDVEHRFFTDYFRHGYDKWDTDCAERLLSLGEPLKKAIKVLGFDKNVNPILGFITDDDVISNLVRTKLLNINTFKAIYTAVAKKLVADSEFFTLNDYNIIYCRDFYTKPVNDMLEYLKLQSRILNVSANSYSVELLEKNRKVFIFDDNISEKDPIKRAAEVKKDYKNRGKVVKSADMLDGKLNSLEEAKSIYHALSGHTVDTENNDANAQQTSAEVAETLTAELSTPAEVLAATQFLSIATGSPMARKALNTNKFTNIPTADLIKATTKVSELMANNRITKADADKLAAALLAKL